MDKRKIRGVQLSDEHSIHYFQMSGGELSMTVDCVLGSLVITEKELLSYLQSRNSLKDIESPNSADDQAEKVSLPSTGIQQLKAKIAAIADRIATIPTWERYQIEIEFAVKDLRQLSAV